MLKDYRFKRGGVDGMFIFHHGKARK